MCGYVILRVVLMRFGEHPMSTSKKKKNGKRKGKLLARVLTSYDCTQKKNRVAGGMSTYPKKKGTA